MLLSSKPFYIDEEAIPTVLEKKVKCLGGWYDAAFNDKEQIQGLRQ